MRHILIYNKKLTTGKGSPIFRCLSMPYCLPTVLCLKVLEYLGIAPLDGWMDGRIDG